MTESQCVNCPYLYSGHLCKRYDCEACTVLDCPLRNNGEYEEFVKYPNNRQRKTVVGPKQCFFGGAV
jgi:hypothetical protein